MILRSLFVLLVFALLGCGGGLEDTTLWKIEGNGLTEPSYLFGTIHIGCNIKLRNKVLRALEETETLILEVDPDEFWPEEEYLEEEYSEEEYSEGEYIQIPNGKSLRDYMTDQEYDLVRNYLHDFIQFDIDDHPTIHPISLGISTVPPELSCYVHDSFERALTDAAWDIDKNIYGLETAAFQLETIASAPIEENIQHIIKAAKSGKPSSSDPLRMLLIHYKNQNLDGISRLIFSDKYFNNYQMNETLLDKRNHNWIPKIDSIVKKNPALVAVGVGHLIGEQGLINLLKEEGYEISPVLK